MRAVTRVLVGLLATAGLSSAAHAQTRLEIRPPSATVMIGREVRLQVFAGTAGNEIRVDTGARFDEPSCGRIRADGTFVPRAPGVCTVTAHWTDPNGRALTATTTVTVVDGYRAMPPPTGAHPPPGDPLPQFPWPPPRATARARIPRGLITWTSAPGTPRPASGFVDTLGRVADSIEHALNHARIESSVYAIGDSGFAYVTRAEMIGDAGQPFPPPDRFPNDVVTAVGGRGFLDFIVSRFRARPGFFRIIAIVVTSRPTTPRSAPLTLAEGTRLVGGGMATLPAVLRNRAVRNLECVALIYEFERPSAVDSVALRTAPRVSAREHLAAAGLWTIAQLGEGP